MSWVYLGRLALEIDKDWLGSGQSWRYVKPLGNEPIPLPSVVIGGGPTGSSGNVVNPSISGVTEITRAFSTRRVNINYKGPYVLVRRESDNQLRKFAVYGGEDWESYFEEENGLLDWLGSSVGKVVTWYDQSGRGEHATAENPEEQPEIRFPEGYNYPYLWFDGDNDYFRFPEEININLMVAVLEEEPDATDQDRGFLAHTQKTHFARGSQKQWFANLNSNTVVSQGEFHANGVVADPRTTVPETDWQIISLKAGTPGTASFLGRGASTSRDWHGGITEVLLSRSSEDFDGEETYKSIFDDFYGEPPELDDAEEEETQENTTPPSSGDSNTGDTPTDSGGSQTDQDAGSDETPDVDTGDDSSSNPESEVDYILNDGVALFHVFSTRLLSEDVNHPLIKVQRANDNLQRYFGEIGGSDTQRIWYAYDDPDNGLGVWLGNQAGYLLQWWSQNLHRPYVTYGGRIIPNALGKFPSVWFNGQSTRLIIYQDKVAGHNLLTAHVVAKEDTFGASSSGEILSGLPRGEEGEWASTTEESLKIRSGSTKLNGVTADFSFEKVSKDWSIASILSGEPTLARAIGCRADWVRTSDTGGVGIQEIFQTKDFFRGEIAEVILGGRIDNDIEGFYTSAKNGFGLTDLPEI